MIVDVNKDILRFDTPVKGEKQIRSGTVYSHKLKTKLRMTTFQIPACKRNSKVTKRQLNYKAQSVNKFLNVLSGSDDPKEVEILLGRFGKVKNSLFVSSVKRAGLTIQRKMTPSEGAQLMSLLRLSNLKMRELRRVLVNTKVGNFLPSEPSDLR